jgi:beta-glucosidase-like glycosyl hydrolase
VTPAQLVFPAYRFEEPDEKGIVELVRRGVGGICLYGGSLPEWIDLTERLQKEATTPLLFCADFENGAGQMLKEATEFPTSMALAATGYPRFSEIKAEITATEARAIGVNLVFAPCVDLNTNPRNPIINIRSYGDDLETAVSHGRAALSGFRNGSVLSCLKHFPGHGDVTADSHISLPVLAHDRRRLEEVEIAPFRRLADEADCVMTAHLLARSLDPERPASISRTITGELLRDELGFSGLVISDALTMGGIRETPEDEVVVRAIQAGADVLLYPVDPGACIDRLEKALKEGEFHEGRLNESLLRIHEAKLRTDLLLDPRGVKEFPDGLRGAQHVGKAEYREAAMQMAEASITVVRYEEGLLPVQGPIRYIPIVDATASRTTDHFREAIGPVGEEGSVTVVAVFIKPRAWAGGVGLTDEQAAPIRQAIEAGERVIVLSFGSPYILQGLPGRPVTVCAYSDCEASQVAAARALRGAIPFKGSLPVRLS